MLPEKPAVRGLPLSIVGLAALGLAVALGVAVLRPIFRQQPITGQRGEAVDPYTDPIETADDAINALSNGLPAIVTATSAVAYRDSSIDPSGAPGAYGIDDLSEIERDAMDFLAHYVGNDIDMDQVVVRKTTTSQFDKMRSFSSNAAEEPVWIIAYTIREQSVAGSSSANAPSLNQLGASGATPAYYVFRAATGDMIERGRLGSTHPFFTLDELAALPRE